MFVQLICLAAITMLQLLYIVCKIIFKLKINGEDEKGCTEKRQTWNQPKQKKVDAQPSYLVTLTKKVFGMEKRPKLCQVNQWDCRPMSRRTLQSKSEKSTQSNAGDENQSSCRFCIFSCH